MAIQRDSVLSGVARAAMVAPKGIPVGISIEALTVCGLGSAIPFLAFEQLWMLLNAIPLYALCLSAEKKDPRFFRKARLWMLTVGLCNTRPFWKGASVSPMPPRRF